MSSRKTRSKLETQMLARINAEVTQLAEKHAISTALVNVLRYRAPALAVIATKNIEAASEAGKDTEPEIEKAVRYYARNLARQRGLYGQQAIHLAWSDSWLKSLPCCSKAFIIWPLCKRGC